MTALLTALASVAFGLALTALVGGMAGAAGSERQYARKVFHLGVFSGAVPFQLLQGFWGVVIYGSVISVLVLAACWHGPGDSLYQALIRTSDGPESRASILRPLFSTALGGLLAVLLVGRLAAVGYLVCGWGDAGGEWVGRRWGRHRFSRPFSGASERRRSLEGSLAVFLLGSLGACVALLILGYPIAVSWSRGLVCGAVGAVAEGASSPGSDNFWVQLLPALSAWWLLG